MSSPRRPLIAVLALSALAAGGCGDHQSASTQTASTAAPTSTTAAAPAPDRPSRSPACRAVSAPEVAAAIAAAGGRSGPLDRAANDSLDLSSCEFRRRSGANLYVEVTIDTAAQAAYRYYVLLAEGRQRATFDAIPDSSKPIGVRGLGDDSVDGGVGAFWVKLTNQLIAVDRGRLVKASVHVPGLGDGASREVGAKLAAEALRG